MTHAAAFLGFTTRGRGMLAVSMVANKLKWSFVFLLGPLSTVTSGCSRNEDLERSTFYSRRVEPFLVSSCAVSPTGSGCHVLADDRGNALGNLSVETYEDVSRRPDLLLDYGPYGLPAFLLKVVPDYTLSLTTYDSTSPTLITTSVAHGGERLLDFATPNFTTLENWIRGGAAENNAPQRSVLPPFGDCAEPLGTDAAFDPERPPEGADYGTFRVRVGAMLGERCAGSSCHGSPANSLYLTCGETEAQLRWNYFAASDYVSLDPDSSEIVRRVLDPAAGGSYHEGGVVFRSTEEPEYQDLLAWATERGGPLQVPSSANFAFFAQRVQPMLVKRGCMMFGCHSAAMFHDYRLRGGSGGHFGLPATRKNYELSLEQLALESPHPNASRLLKKNLSPSAGGLVHRGGPLFAGSSGPESCDLAAAEAGPLDEQSPYCVIVAWIARERAERMAGALGMEAIVYVRRTPETGRDAPQDFADFAPGSELVRVAAAEGVDGAITLGAESSLSALCGLTPASSEVRRPQVSWDGRRLAFSARVAEGEPLRVYVVDGDTCSPDAAIDAPAVSEGGSPLPTNGELVHNFDPSFAPDGRIVFVSTRGNTKNGEAFSYQGPQRTPSDPSKLNTNLYVREPDGSIRQLTFLLNQELLPSFMRDGRVIFSTEKRAPGFYQLAGRRINLDGGDYHPLYGQRSSIGFTQLSDVVELSDKNFAAILSDRGARRGAGTLAVINRSLGIDQLSLDPLDYPVNPSAVQYPVPGFYQHSLSIVNPEATGKLGSTGGAYASPSPLPDGRVLVSYAPGVTDLAGFDGDFDVAVVDPERSGPSSTTVLVSGPSDALWPVAVYARPNHGVFRSRLDEANGATRIDPRDGKDAEVTFLDLPLLSTLLFQNTRDGRDFSSRSSPVEIWESLPPETGVVSFESAGAFLTQDQYGPLYVRRSRLGSVEPLADGSAKVLLRGGAPFVLATRTELASDPNGPIFHFQREEMQVYPGERARQSFPRSLFNGLCGGCHGSVMGLENHVATTPDILTRASDVQALPLPPIDLRSNSGAPEGPVFP